MFCMHSGAPYREVHASEAFKEFKVCRSSTFVFLRRALLNKRLVGTTLQFLLNIVLFCQFLQSHRKPFLSVAFAPHIKIYGREVATTVAHAIILNMPAVVGIAWRIELCRRRAFITAQAELLLGIVSNFGGCRTDVGDDVQTSVGCI